MSDDPSVEPSVLSTTVEVATARYVPIIDKTPPRPAPTMAYSWKECNPRAKVLYIRDHNEANSELSKLPHGPQALGFDLEWKPTYIRGVGENPVALVQLANNDTVYLLQVSAMKEFPSNLVQILADPLIIKSGVAIESDAKKLYNDFKIDMQNCVDLSLLARTVDNARWQGKYKSPLGLARLIETYEYRLLGKGKVTRSNWEADLDPLQIEYASNDAHAGYTLYRKLDSMKAALPSPPEHTWFSFNMISGQLLDAQGFAWHPVNPNYDPGPSPPPRPPREPRTGDNEGEISTAAKQHWRSKRADQDHRNNIRPQSFNNSFYTAQRNARSPELGGIGPVSTYTSIRGGRNWNQQQYYGQQSARSHGSFEPYTPTMHDAVAVQAPFQAREGGSSSNASPFLNAQRRALNVNGMGMRQDGSSYNNRSYNRGRDALPAHNRQGYPSVHDPYSQSVSTDQGQGRGRARAKRYHHTDAVEISSTPQTLQDNPPTKL
ncbi:ribonuclease H-like domain-containing protein [Pholiota molesta]|nr:ribonuclease H-like domain-containing protein [Pholiota molesta]